MVVNTTKIKVLPEKRTEFLQTIKRLVEPIKSARGCRSFHLYVDLGDENSSLLFGEWETESDLNNHTLSNDFSILRGAIKVLSVEWTDLRTFVRPPLSDSVKKDAAMPSSPHLKETRISR